MSSLSKWGTALAAILSSTPVLANNVALPEPGTLGLLACGLVFVVAVTFRKRK